MHKPAIVPEAFGDFSAMLDATKGVFRAALGTDPTITNEEKQAWSRIIAKGSPLADAPAIAAPLPRLVTAAEVARLTGLSVQCIRKYARAGTLDRVVGRGRSRGRGYTEASVRAFLEGRLNPAPKSADESVTAQKVEG